MLNARPRRLSREATALLEKATSAYLNNIGDIPPSIRGEVYIAVVNQAVRGQEIHSLPALAASIHHRRKTTEARRRLREQTVEPELLDQVADDDDDNDDHQRDVLVQRIREASLGLSSRAQSIIELRLQGYSLREIAIALGITYGAAQRASHRAVAALQVSVRVTT